MPVELDASAAAVIAAGMRAVAKADGEVHAREVALIEDFASMLPAQLARSADQVREGELASVYVHSLVMVAMADGVVSDDERKVIVGLAAELGVDEAAVDVEIAQVKRAFLKAWAEKHPLPHQVRAAAAELGLAEGDADAAMPGGQGG